MADIYRKYDSKSGQWGDFGDLKARQDIGIVEDSDVAENTILNKQYVVWKGKLYKANTAITPGTTLSTSNLTEVPDGGLNNVISKEGDGKIADGNFLLKNTIVDAYTNNHAQSYTGLYYEDKNGGLFGFVEASQSTYAEAGTDGIVLYIGARAKSTNGTVVTNGIKLIVKKDGTRDIVFDDTSIKTVKTASVSLTTNVAGIINYAANNPASLPMKDKKIIGAECTNIVDSICLVGHAQGAAGNWIKIVNYDFTVYPNKAVNVNFHYLYP